MLALDVAGNSATLVVSFIVDINIFNPSGPYEGIPTYALI